MNAVRSNKFEQMFNYKSTAGLKTFQEIRQLYRPVQPTVKPSVEQVAYAEFMPAAELQSFIYCYWHLKTTQPLLEAFQYRVVADGCMDLFFDLNSPQESYVMGFCNRFTEFTLEKSFHYVGVRFLPTGFPHLFRINASELCNHAEALSAVVPAVSSFIENNFHPWQTAKEVKGLFDHYFLERISKIRLNRDNRLHGAIEIILKEAGVIDIEKDLDTAISIRQLRRLFKFYIGDTPKAFSKVVRFQNILRAKPSSQSLRKNKLFFDAGYYDQAHFIKEFKNFYGIPPSKAFER